MQRAFVSRALPKVFVAAVAYRQIARPGVAVSQSRTPMVTVSTVNSLRFYSGGGHEENAPRSGQYLLDKNDVLTRVLEVVKNFEKVDASKVTPESHFVNDLGLNSLDVVEVVFAIEQEFILDIPDHDAEKIQSIPDAVEYIAQNPMAK